MPTAAVLGVVFWVVGRPAARRADQVAAPVSAVTLSGVVFAVIAVASLQVATPFATGTTVSTPAAVPSGHSASTSAAATAPRVADQPTRPATSPAVAVATVSGTTEVDITPPGNLMRQGQTNREQIVVHTAAGDLEIVNEGRNDDDVGLVCASRLVTCS